MRVPTSEVCYTFATARRGDHESSYEHVVALEEEEKNPLNKQKYGRYDIELYQFYSDLLFPLDI